MMKTVSLSDSGVMLPTATSASTVSQAPTTQLTTSAPSASIPTSLKPSSSKKKSLKRKAHQASSVKVRGPSAADLLVLEWVEQNEKDNLHGISNEEALTKLNYIREVKKKTAEELMELELEEFVQGEFYDDPLPGLNQVKKLIKRRPKESRMEYKFETPWENVTIVVPFQEDLRPRIWRSEKNIKKIDEHELRGLEHLKGTAASGHIWMLRNMSADQNDPFGHRERLKKHSDSMIIGIKSVEIHNCGSVRYPVIEFERQNGVIQRVSEVDLYHVVLKDLIQLLFEYIPKH
ncbi:unnamed protein product [Cuscuta europaea]|nr:unnamed protein product [Cuscuta europaea]